MDKLQWMRARDSWWKYFVLSLTANFILTPLHPVPPVFWLVKTVVYFLFDSWGICNVSAITVTLANVFQWVNRNQEEPERTRKLLGQSMVHSSLGYWTYAGQKVRERQSSGESGIHSTQAMGPDLPGFRLGSLCSESLYLNHVCIHRDYERTQTNG